MQNVKIDIFWIDFTYYIRKHYFLNENEKKFNIL